MFEHGVKNEAQLFFDALTMAIWQRQPKAGLIVHSDQGGSVCQSSISSITQVSWVGWQYE